MRLQIIDPKLNFACKACTSCCDQPWRTVIEPERAAALDAVDWGAEFPALRGRTLYTRARSADREVLELGKGEGTRCVFLDTDNLCIIHKKLGYDAKPRMCKQFPFFAARAWDADYVSANYGCKAVQDGAGRPAMEQADEIAAVVPLTPRPPRPDAMVLLTRAVTIPQDAAIRLCRLLAGVFAADGEGSIVTRLARAIAMAERAVATRPEALADDIQSGALVDGLSVEPVEPFASAAAAPLPARLLFAATLFPDTLPADSTYRMGFFRRMTLVPKLMALTKIRGGYASRLLGRNIRLDELLAVPADRTIAADAEGLLRRYLEARLWQQFPAGTRLPILSAVHQHVLDILAVTFYASALAEPGQTELSRAVIEKALMLVEFHLANQPRLHTQALKNWLQGALDAADVARATLRMMRCRPAAGHDRPASLDVAQLRA